MGKCRLRIGLFITVSAEILYMYFKSMFCQFLLSLCDTCRMNCETISIADNDLSNVKIRIKAARLGWIKPNFSA